MKAFYAAAVVVAVTLGQSVTPSADPYSEFINLGVGALVAAPFAYLWRDERRQRQASDKRYRELLERMGPILADATRTLAEVQAGMQAQVESVRASREHTEWETALRRFENLAEEMRQEVRRANERRDGP